MGHLVFGGEIGWDYEYTGWNSVEGRLAEYVGRWSGPSWDYWCRWWWWWRRNNRSSCFFRGERWRKEDTNCRWQVLGYHFTFITEKLVSVALYKVISLLCRLQLWSSYTTAFVLHLLHFWQFWLNNATTQTTNATLCISPIFNNHTIMRHKVGKCTNGLKDHGPSSNP